MSTTTAYAVDLETVDCGECGGTYAISARYKQQKRDKGGFWHCPYCQVSWGYGTSTLDRVKREKEEAEQRARNAVRWAESEQRRAQHQARRAVAFKGQVTKVKRKVARGECPCCRSTFPDLTAHMSSEHPDWAPDAEQDSTE